MTATERSQHDEEYRQACARVVLSCVALAVCLSVWFWQAGGTTARPLSTAAVAAVYGVFSAAWAALVRRYRGVFVARRLIIVCTDLAVTAFATYMLGPLGGGFYPIYLWIVVGNGMRFGPRYLYAATAAAGVSFGMVLLCGAHWQQQLPVGLSLLIGICVLPLFYANLIENMHGLNRELTLEKLELLRTRERLHELATRDSLTGLWNRRTVLEHLVLELERTRREQQPLTVMVADLDHFKAINDQHGHQAGDTVLSEVASRLLAELRPYDFVGRYGGEELMLVLPGVGRPAALECADRLREAIAAPIRLSDRTELVVTCSFGVMTLSTSAAATPDELIRQADAALYAAKRRGRNRVEESTSPAAM